MRRNFVDRATESEFDSEDTDLDWDPHSVIMPHSPATAHLPQPTLNAFGFSPKAPDMFALKLRPSRYACIVYVCVNILCCELRVMIGRG